MKKMGTQKCVSKSGKKGKRLDYSQKLIADIRWLLWVVTIGGLALAALCIYKGYLGSLPWLSAMVACLQKCLFRGRYCGLISQMV